MGHSVLTYAKPWILAQYRPMACVLRSVQLFWLPLLPLFLLLPSSPRAQEDEEEVGATGMVRVAREQALDAGVAGAVPQFVYVVQPGALQPGAPASRGSGE